MDAGEAVDSASCLPISVAVASTPSLILPSPSSNSSPHQSASSPQNLLSFQTTSSPLVPRACSSSHSHLPAHHQVLTPSSKTLILPETPHAPHSPRSPAPSPPSSSPLSSRDPEDRFLPVHLTPSSPTLLADVHFLLTSLYYPFLSPPLSPSASSLALTPVTGGITNTLYRASLHPPLPASPVLIRVFGPSTEQVIDRLTEAVLVVALSKARFGVRLLGHFSNGRLEQWLDARALQWHEMPAMAAAIGAKIGELHRQDLSAVVATERSPLYTTLVGWMKAARAVEFPEDAEKAALLSALDVGFWQAELDLVLALLASSSLGHGPLVFAHNDLLAGNILVQSARPSLYLVDFEYASYNFAAFDIANHFLECCGFDCRWDCYPSREQRAEWLSAYLREVGRGGEDVEEWDERVRGFLVLSHLWWGIWAVLQAKHSTIDFDYLGYSLLRKEGYLRMKDDSIAVLKKYQVGGAT